MKNWIFALLLTCVSLGAGAESYNYLNLKFVGGGERSLPADGLLITFSDGNLVSGDTVIPLSQLGSMYFSDTAAQTGVVGDFNNDGIVNVTDVNILVSAVLLNSTDTTYDLNGDGNVNVSDINIEVSIVLNSTQS